MGRVDALIPGVRVVKSTWRVQRIDLSSSCSLTSFPGMSADGSYNQGQLQDVMNKLDELISALRR